MRKSPPKMIIEVKEHDQTTVELEVTNSIIDFYKKETGRNRVTTKGLSQFLNRLIEFYNRN
jgi:hypothetical protein